MELHKLTIHEACNLLRKKEISCYELVEAVAEQIEKVEKNIHAFITLSIEQAFRNAAKVDKILSSGETLSPLAGIPMGLKDNICTAGVRTTCASKMLSNFVPPYDATVVLKLKKTGSVLLGKLNMDEFAMGSSTESSYFGETFNPWDLSRVPGGSSGGSAAAVASDEVFFSLGSDTGGSVRQPAAFCGVVGLKPTYGLVSRFGLIEYASSLDQIGPITKDVTDCAMVLSAIAGYDPSDSTSVKTSALDYTDFLIDDVKDFKIGIPREYFGEGLHIEVQKAIQNAVRIFEELGARVEEVSLPSTEYALPAYYIIATAEASSNLARFDGVKYGYRAEHAGDLADLYKKTRSLGFGTEVKRRIILGTYTLSSGYYEKYYLKALKVRTLIKRDFDEVFKSCDIILCPTSPTTAFRIGEKKENPMEMYLSDVYTVPVNLAGLPAISIPCGYDNDGMPIGLQLIGRAFGEGDLIRAAYTFERNTDFHLKKPATFWG